jgi:hypothetical protein
MSVWVFIWLMVALKIPIVALFLIVRWAVKQAPDQVPGSDGGIGPPARPRHPRPPFPRAPRRGPHGEPALASPPRVRTLAGARQTPAGTRLTARSFPQR